MEELIIEQGPALWIHGHVNEVRDYVLGNTQSSKTLLVIRPNVTPEETGFHRELIVTLPD